MQENGIGVESGTGNGNLPRTSSGFQWRKLVSSFLYLSLLQELLLHPLSFYSISF